MDSRIQELFQLYLQRKCSPAEAAEFLSYFREGQHQHLPEELMLQQYEQPVEAPSPAQEEVYARVEQELMRQAAGHEDTGARPRYRRLLLPLSVAASVALIAFLGYLYFPQIQNWFSPVQYRQVTTLRGQLKQLRLADGTQVWLGPGSSFSYPDRFRGEEREVSLAGEAYFEVSHDTRHPFVVKTSTVTTQVLGTSFNIQAYNQRKYTEVTLVSGKVSVADTNRKIFLQSNEQAVFNGKLRTLVKRSYPEAADYLQRRDGRLVYHAAPLFKVVSDIRLFFNIDVDIDSQMGGCLVTGTFSATEDPDDVIRQLAFSSNAQIKKSAAGTYLITGGRCN